MNTFKTTILDQKDDNEFVAAIIYTKVGGILTETLVDSGACISAITTKLFDELKAAGNQCELKPYTGRNIKSATNNALQIIGQTTIDVVIAGQRFVLTVAVTNTLPHDFVLGTNLLVKLRMSINLPKGVVIFQDDVLIPLCIFRTPRGQNPVRLCEDIVIINRVIQQVRVECNVPSPGEYIFESSCSSRDQIQYFARTLHRFKESGKQTFVISVGNIPHEHLMFYAGQVVGVLESIDTISTIVDVETDKVINTRKPDIIPNTTTTTSTSTTADIVNPSNTKLYKMPAQDENIDAEIEARIAEANTLTEEQKIKLRELLHHNKDQFTLDLKKLGAANVEPFHIQTTSDIPVKQRNYRRSPEENTYIDKIVNTYQEAGLIEDSNSPWGAPVLLARKKDGSWRFCIDYRALNNTTVTDSYQLPRVDDIFDSLGGALYFSHLDCFSGYWQIKVKEEDKPKTAFVVRSGLKQWNVLPFGLKNAPPAF